MSNLPQGAAYSPDAPYNEPRNPSKRTTYIAVYISCVNKQNKDVAYIVWMQPDADHEELSIDWCKASGNDYVSHSLDCPLIDTGFEVLSIRGSNSMPDACIIAA